VSVFRGTVVLDRGPSAEARVDKHSCVAPDADPSRRSRAGRPFVVVVAAAAAAQAHAAATRGRAGRRAMIGQHGRARRPICPSPSIVGRFPVTIPEMLSRADLVPRSVRWMDGWMDSLAAPPRSGPDRRNRDAASPPHPAWAHVPRAVIPCVSPLPPDCDATARACGATLPTTGATA